jgi:hypothetical protein
MFPNVRFWRAITTASVIIGDCFQEVAKLISMAEIRRERPFATRKT